MEILCILDLMSRFKKAYIEISDICGLNCSFCPSPKGKRGVMSLQIFEKICFELQGKCERIALHILGDPLKNKDLMRYLSIALSFEHQVEIVTSGFYLQNWDFDLLLSPPVKQFNISLSAYTDSHNLKKQDYLQECLRFCAFHQKKKSSCFVNLRMHKSRLDEEIGREICRFFGVSCHFVQNRVRLGRYLFLRLSQDFEWIDDSRQKQKQKTCHGLISQIGFLSNGRIVPCCIDSEGKIDLGDIAIHSLDEVLSSSLVCNMMKGFRENYAYHPVCQYCTYPANKKWTNFCYSDEKNAKG